MVLKKVAFIFIFILLCTFVCKAQDSLRLKKAVEYLLENKIEKAYKEIKIVSNSNEKDALLWHLDAFYFGIRDTIVISKKKYSSSFENILHLLKEGEIYQEPFFDKDTLAFNRYREALDISFKKKDSLLIRLTLTKLLKFTFTYPKLFDILEEYAEIYKAYIVSINDEVIYNFYRYSAMAIKTYTPYIEVYKNDLIKIKDSENYYLIGLLNQMLGSQVCAFEKDFEKGIYYFEKADEAYSKVPGIMGKKQMFAIYNNIAAAYNYKNEPKKALTYFSKAKKVNFRKIVFQKNHITI